MRRLLLTLAFSGYLDPMAENNLFLLLGKHHTPHTKEAHERYLMSKSLINRLAGREKMVQQLLSAGLALSSIWEKARARGRQR
jgi:hypothetical protein